MITPNKPIKEKIITMKNKLEVKSMSDTDLEHKLADEQAMLTKLKFSHAVSQIENPMTIRKSRRTIARLLTELNARSNKSNK